MYFRCPFDPWQSGYRQKALFEESHFLLFWDVFSVVFKEKQGKECNSVCSNANYSRFFGYFRGVGLCPGWWVGLCPGIR